MSPDNAVETSPADMHSGLQIDDLVSILSDLTSGLRRAASASEDDFLNLGLRLQTVHGQAVELGGRAMEAAGFIGNKSEDGLLVRAGDLARESLTELEGYREEISGNLSYVEVVIDRLGRLFSKCGQLERIGKFLRVVALNTGVESAKSKRASRVFSGFAHEIMEFAERVIEVAEVVRRESDTARSRQVSALEEINRGTGEFSTLIGDSRGVLLKALDKIDELFKKSFGMMEQAGERIKEVSDSIGELVVGVQLHDSMNQRIEHCVGAMEQAGRLLEEIKSDRSDSEEVRKKYGAVRLILNLQNEQIGQVVSDIEKAHDRSLRAFDGIIREIGLLSRSLADMVHLDFEPAGKQDKRGEDPFSALKSALQRLNGLLLQGRGMMDRMTGATGQASAAADNLAGQTTLVVNISYRVHLMAINAILKASSLGIQGRTLEVLAEEVSHLARQSGDFVVEVNSIIEPIKDSVEALQTRTAKGAGLTASTRLDEESLEAGLKEVSAAFTEFTERSRSAFDLAGSLKTAVIDSREGLGFLTDLAGGYSRDVERLAEGIRMLAPWADAGDSEAFLGLTGLARRYTMEQERDAHQRVLGPDGQLDDQGGELFEDGDVELFGPEVEAGGEPTKKEKIKPEAEEQEPEDDDLGDNVELF